MTNYFEQYLDEVAQFEKYGGKNVISYEDWLHIKVETDDSEELKKAIAALNVVKDFNEKRFK